jgi:hypothetical protein
MLQVSFGLFGDRGTALARAAGLATRMVYARMYDRAHWPLGEILGDTYRLTQFSGGEKKLALIGTDSVRFNTDIFLLEAANGKLPFNITTTAYETDLRTLLRLLNSADYFIYREGGEPTASFFNILGAEAVKEVRESGRFEELPISRTLPDGGVAHVFRQKR